MCHSCRQPTPVDHAAYLQEEEEEEKEILKIIQTKQIA